MEVGLSRKWARPGGRALPQAARPPSASPIPVPGARAAPLPSFVAPQLATLVTAPPSGDGWLHETKFDGYRILCRLAGGRATLWSRNARDWSAQFPEIAEAAARLPAKDAIVDGEIAVLLENGTTSFQALQHALSGGGQGRLVYFVFDLLHLDGHDLKGASLEDRKRALERLLRPRESGSIRYSRHVVGQGEPVLREACRLGLEGIVSKLRAEPYESGRGRGWLKVKCGREQEFVVAGFTEPQGARVGLGALLLGVHDAAGDLVYAGKVGTGFTEAAARTLRARLDGLRVSAVGVPPPARRGRRALGPARARGRGRLHRVDRRRPAAPPGVQGTPGRQVAAGRRARAAPEPARRRRPARGEPGIRHDAFPPEPTRGEDR